MLGMILNRDIRSSFIGEMIEIVIQKNHIFFHRKFELVFEKRLA